jgi:histidinol-phosphate aminotransferase
MNYMSEKAQKLHPYAAGLQPREPGWIKLNTNENPYPPSPKVIQAIHHADIAGLRLYPDTICEGLCRAIAAKWAVRPENIFCGNGSDEVLALAFQAFFAGKKHVLTPNISYGFYPVWGEVYGAGLTFVPLNDDLTLDSSLYQNANGVMIANPNAPTGMAISLAEVESIVRNNLSGVVIIDEAYMDFADEQSAIGLIDQYENLLVIRTFSKSYSLAGLRVGFAAGSQMLIDGLRRLKDAFNSYPVNRLSQIGAAAALDDDEYYTRNRMAVIHTRRWVENKLGCAASQANFIFWKTQDAQARYNDLLKHKILVRYWDKPGISQYLRVTIGTPLEMEAFWQCVKKF